MAEDPVVAASGSEFISIANNNELSSKLIGLDIYNNSKQNIGQIKNGDKSAGRGLGQTVSVWAFSEWANATLRKSTTAPPFDARAGTGHSATTSASSTPSLGISTADTS
jgi:hypothetical protein